MWSGPRNLSTALMRAFENRGDTAVWDEPFYACYLSVTGSDHPGAAEVIAAGETDWRRVVERLTGKVPGNRAVYFQKHMTHHLLPSIDRCWMDDVENCFLIRDPRQVIASYSRIRDEVAADDVGIAQQAEIYDHVVSRCPRAPLVLDARDLLENPRRMLSALCERLGIAFTERMLSWPPGPRPSDGVWARHWYRSVRESTGFKTHVPTAHRLPAHLEPLARESERHYRRLWRHRLTEK
ncbi:MAG: HAD family hydrolase [Gammaproteobacteria bacterium]|nr:HAD family hydrolase [Gammaproteobacteria bacterium]